jgi:multidrug resistance efflux pump
VNSRRIRTRGSATSIIIILVVVLAVAVAAALWLRNGLDEGSASASDTQVFRVAEGSFDINIPCSGELEALRQIEVRNQLESRAVITYIAPEGSYVQKGEELIHLAEEDILNRIKDAEDALNTARASLVAAEAKLEIQQSARDSDLDAAKLEVELSQLALQGWLEGEVVSQLEQLALAWETAKINYERLAERFQDSVTLEAEGFISSDELKQHEIEMIKGRADLAQANLNIDVYARYTYPQDEARTESTVEQAIAELDRVRQRHEAELNTARADVVSKRFQVESREQRLADLRLQHSYCSTKAPSDGLVVYASSIESRGRRGGDDQPPQVGTELRPNELVILLPDTSQMIAAVKVNESLSGLIEPGQMAQVVSDALPETSIPGEVLSIGVLAEGGGWRDPNRRDYTVRILLDTPESHPLKPSMRCKADLHIGKVSNALYMPIQAVFRESRGAAVAYVPEGTRYRAQPIELGRSSELFVEVTGGLEAGDAVLLRKPRPEEIASPTAVLASNSESEAEGAAGRSGPPRGMRGGMGGRPGGARPSGQQGGGEGRGSGGDGGGPRTGAAGQGSTQATAQAEGNAGETTTR